ncbi:phosphoribosylformylglycinamidine synthase subunit PurQ [Stappia sp. 28M-7]|uniref:phosphoribosylformylglycinamidine synthase subunit PurQ n=1 Tax=Stappia sp. 28M-7 TaxID=2762596 RepID=UPI00163BE1B0|nr:phosphoribosylformylglycinamidine synthase subunit PurQ [Stappia sp. 28M-7]MBC2860266.1 phosphoribosylformylglycinamidine synthase subunit PurQ [Stappia sp. 28M-7]
MKSAVVTFPGSNRERDMMHALELVSGRKPEAVWHADTSLPDVDLVVLPGGFSYGDYLRSGAIAARAPVMDAIRAFAARGGMVLGVCNGFQMLTEAGLLPGALMRNAGLTFVCREVQLETASMANRFTAGMRKGETWRCPVAHHDGNYFADAETIARLEGENRVAFRYANGTNPNGSINDIAGIANEAGNVLGMMPHPENYVDAQQASTDGRAFFESICGAFATA